MASIQKRPNGRWRARYRDQAGREHARHFDRKLDAQRWLDEVTAAVVTGRYVDPRAGVVTFRDYAEQWRQAQVHRPQTAVQYESKLRLHAYPVLGDMPIRAIRPSRIQALAKRLSTATVDRDALAASTVRLVMKIVSMVFTAAVNDKLIAESPCVGVKTPKPAKTRVQPLTLEQVDTLHREVPEELRALITLVASTGLRPSEAWGMTRDRLRLLGRSPAMVIDRQLIGVADGGPVFGPPKTEASNRVVPLPRSAVAALNDHIAKYDVGVEDLLFKLNGKPITSTRFFYAFESAKIAAKLTPATGTGLHSLRHFYASLLIRHGESVKVVQSRLGHASAAETLDTYSHLWPDSDDRTREAVDSVLLDRSADHRRTAGRE
jgi:integrase